MPGSHRVHQLQTAFDVDGLYSSFLFLFLGFCVLAALPVRNNRNTLCRRCRPRLMGDHPIFAQGVMATVMLARMASPVDVYTAKLN